MSLEDSVFARKVKPYLNKLLAFLPWFLILIGQTVSRNIPILYAQTKATRTKAKSLLTRSISVKCVSSILKQLDFRARNKLCKAFHNTLKDHKAAIADLNKSLELNPQYEPALGCRGNEEIEMGDYKGAIDDFNNLLEINPKAQYVFSNRGFAKWHLKDNEGAIADYLKEMETNPKNAYPYLRRGLLYCGLTDYKKAIPDFDKAIELDPKYGEAFAERGVAKILTGDKISGTTDLHKAKELGYNNANELINKYSK
jgi:tetratricopeptide (TPR) repeat protein